MSEYNMVPNDKRANLLETLKQKRQGISTATPSTFPPSSPESVLVPASSSPPGARPSTSKFFAPSSNAISGHAPRPTSTIASSRLGNATANGGAAAGTPASVVGAIARRHEDGAAGKALGETSPTSPAPLSRLKSKYDATPVKNGLGSTHSSPLVQAARKQVGVNVEEMAGRIAVQFPSFSRDQIIKVIQQHPNNVDEAINQLTWHVNHGPNSARPGGTSTPVPTPDPVEHVELLPRAKRLGKTSGKNINSSIYANRNKKDESPSSIPSAPTHGSKLKGKAKRRDPDESASKAEAKGGDSDESEMDWSGDEGRRKRKRRDDDDEVDAQGAALKAFNEVSAEMLTGTIACSEDQAKKIISLRPYADADDVYFKLNKARGVSNKLFEQYTEIMEGYVQIDACLNRCEAIAKDVANTLSVWRGAGVENDSVIGTPRSDGLNDVKVDVNKVSDLLRSETDQRKRAILSRYIQEQPKLLSEGTVLKDYQLLGVNWLNLLYSKKIGCILADEMGLGKTIQVIAFIAHLQSKGNKGPHMILVPASTLENWTREFEKFCPDIDVQTYYGSQSERAALRDQLKRQFRKGTLEVVLASYTQVVSAEDLHFFRKKIEFETCIYDEGHKLKSCTTKAYNDLMAIKPKWRLLLTGTPLQNNLQELVSLLMFIHKDTFGDAEPYLRAIFKSQGHASLLSQQRVSRARTMLTPFVLRRRKAHVLTLPPKIESVERCEMSAVQAKLYSETLGRSKKAMEELDDDALEQAAAADDVAGNTGKAKKGKKAEVKPAAGSSSSHILMDLRKAASHPLLFRRLYTDAKVRSLAKACLNTPQWCDSGYDYVVEDLQYMSDAEISHFCTSSDYDEIRKFALSPKLYLEGGKMQALEKHINRCKKEGKRLLLFSQFVMILDILEVALEHLGVRFCRLDGQTKVDERQGIVDEFTEDPDITVFMLSTKAGGVGINLTAASVVIIYDQDFNPHNDRQAADRAYRIGQDKEVEVFKFITTNSIDEDMFAIGSTKLQLDDAVGGEETSLEADGGVAAQKEDKTAKEMRKSLLSTLRNKFVDKAGAGGEEAIPEVDETLVDVVATPAKKVARGATQATQQTPVKEEDVEQDGAVEIKVDEVKIEDLPAGQVKVEDAEQPVRKRAKVEVV